MLTSTPPSLIKWVTMQHHDTQYRQGLGNTPSQHQWAWPSAYLLQQLGQLVVTAMDLICIFYLLSCTCYSKNNVIFLLSVECQFQRYQGWQKYPPCLPAHCWYAVSNLTPPRKATQDTQYRQGLGNTPSQHQWAWPSAYLLQQLGQLVVTAMDLICIFYLLSCTCYSKNNVIFLLSVECQFQRYQGWQKYPPCLPAHCWYAGKAR